MLQRARFSKIVCASLVALGVGVLGATPAAAGIVTYQILNHPDGNAINVDVDTDGYVLRLDLDGTINTFNANTGPGVFFSFNTETNTGSISGTLRHNESGSGQLWQIDATFSGLHLGSDSASPWYADSSLYDDIVADLLNNADIPATSGEKSIVTDLTAADRIYFEFVDVALTPLSPDPQDYTGPLVWDEHPDTGQMADDKFFYLQYRWRLWDSSYEDSAFDLVGAAGWLEPGAGEDRIGENIKGSQDFLFVFGDRVTTPEPGSALMLLLGGAALAVRRRRTRG